ncbi:AP-3 complex subunit delta [Glycine soja]
MVILLTFCPHLSPPPHSRSKNSPTSPSLTCHGRASTLSCPPPSLRSRGSGTTPRHTFSVIGVFYELTAKDPGWYLKLAPEFYRILVDSKNNWVLINVMKVFAKLAPLEPRLGKIVEPVCDQMRRSGAQALVFKCVRTVLTSLSDYHSAIRLIVEKARDLLALLVATHKHLWVVIENREVVVKSLSDDDLTIKILSVRLLMGIYDISKVFLNVLKFDKKISNQILGSILTCYRNVQPFAQVNNQLTWTNQVSSGLSNQLAWASYSSPGRVSTFSTKQETRLGELVNTSWLKLISYNYSVYEYEEIETQLVDVGMRVKDARMQLVRVGRDLLIDPALLGDVHLHRRLCAAAWIAGEYVEVAANPFELMDALLQPRNILFPPSIRAVYINSALQILIFCLDCYIVHNEVPGSWKWGCVGRAGCVATMVTKLFNIVEPGVAVFGKKDYQQWHLIQRMDFEKGLMLQGIT